jgi:hypothetical protein
MLKQTFAAVMLILCAATARADAQGAYRAKNLMNDLVAVSTDLAKEALRDAEILRRLVDAARALDDWQQQAAVSKALDAIHKAEQLAGQPPFNPRVQILVQRALDAVKPAQSSTMNIDQQKIRNDLRARSIEPMRQIVSEDIGTLARLTSQLTDITNVVAKATSATSAAALGQSE